MSTFEDINTRIRGFWTEQNRRAEQRLRNELLVANGLQVVAGELQRGTPVGCRTDLHAALGDADEFRGEVLRQQASSGGRARKPDALQELIIGIVRRYPSIKRDELLERLRSHAPGPVIVEIADEEIAFQGAAGASKSASLKGLKDRLTRARKALNSR
ncbi:hypothetical protein [Methylobacterium oxalidis]|uniref:hypothetical protein n=1 Tax=Methylobacterium oxalidis TaxID=944322 RepID=UPI0033148862